MRSTVRSIVVCALFTLGCDEATPTDVEGWRGSPGVTRRDSPAPSVSADKAMAWEKLPPLRTSLPPKFIIGADLRPIVLHSQPHAIAGQTLINLDVSRHDGQSWVRYPAVSEADSGHHGYAVALQSDGDPVVAWTEATATGAVVRVGSFDGGAWDGSLPPLAPSTGPAAIVHDPVVRLDGADRPSVSWFENAWPDPVTLASARWDGASWDRGSPDRPAAAEATPERPAAPAAFPPAATWDARLANAPDGTAYAAWTDDAKGPRLGFAWWNGTTWESRSGFEISPAAVLSELIADASGALWVVWTDAGGTRVNVSTARP